MTEYTHATSHDDVQTGEKRLHSPLTGKTYRVTKWIPKGDGKFVAIEKEVVDE